MGPKGPIFYALRITDPPIDLRLAINTVPFLISEPLRLAPPGYGAAVDATLSIN